MFKLNMCEFFFYKIKPKSFKYYDGKCLDWL